MAFCWADKHIFSVVAYELGKTRTAAWERTSVQAMSRPVQRTGNKNEPAEGWKGMSFCHGLFVVQFSEVAN